MQSFRDYLVKELKIPEGSIFDHIATNKLKFEADVVDGNLDGAITNVVSSLSLGIEGIIEGFAFSCRNTNNPLQIMVDAAQHFYSSLGYICTQLPLTEVEGNDSKSENIIVCKGGERSIVMLEYSQKKQILIFAIITHGEEQGESE